MTNRTLGLPIFVWAILVALTVLSVAIIEGGFLRSFSVVAIIFIAAVKSRLLILHYMEAKHAPAHWRLLYEAWNCAAMATIVIGHYVAVGSR